jgi:hypothetical protein
MEHKDKFDPKLNSQLGAELARFHSLEMPFNKAPTYLFEMSEKQVPFSINILAILMNNT